MAKELDTPSVASRDGEFSIFLKLEIREERQWKGKQLEYLLAEGLNFFTRCFILALVSGLRDGQKGRMNPFAHIAHISIPVDR